MRFSSVERARPGKVFSLGQICARHLNYRNEIDIYIFCRCFFPLDRAECHVTFRSRLLEIGFPVASGNQKKCERDNGAQIGRVLHII